MENFVLEKKRNIERSVRDDMKKKEEREMGGKEKQKFISFCF